MDESKMINLEELGIDLETLKTLTKEKQESQMKQLKQNEFINELEKNAKENETIKTLRDNKIIDEVLKDFPELMDEGIEGLKKAIKFSTKYIKNENDNSNKTMVKPISPLSFDSNSSATSNDKFQLGDILDERGNLKDIEKLEEMAVKNKDNKLLTAIQFYKITNKKRMR